MNGTSIGIVNSQKTKICSGNKSRISVCIRFFLDSNKSGDGYVYLYSVSIFLPTEG